jgi:hypothetical protein
MTKQQKHLMNALNTMQFSVAPHGTKIDILKCHHGLMYP